MKDKFVLDSSIWIEIHRENAKILEAVQPLIDRNEICLVDVILAEVLRGARSQKDYNRLQKVFVDFQVIATSWTAVAELAFQVGRKGFYPPLIDLYIAQCMRTHGKILITQDGDFQQIAQVAPFDYQILRR